MSATPESLSRQSQQTPDLESCRLDEYRSARHCCKLCPAGEHVGESCVSPHTQGECAKCEPGTFTKSANGLDSCLLCSTCGDDQEMMAECTATRDRICQCRKGHFYHDPESSEICRQCTKCPPETSVLQECSSTADTVCSSAAPIHTGIPGSPTTHQDETRELMTG
ncbi:tumor necrosis factor receptor superfamily member 22-like isoform X2 [Nannospalax galili]|uniref:tumor necrosis factor receptor superfamily member 22-like isoform X2 n=1 Tax=Nannospalax galili TaxID=1026970 RepID=UPI00111C9122|nr:tumor necrosis factor receptor superfamily member 22-like isoform X2 [Nannospalax galili]